MSDDAHTLAAAYALDAVSAEERRRFEAHRADCPACRAEVLGYREAVATLAEGQASEPPDALKARVMAEVARTRQLPPLVEPQTSAGADDRPGERRAPADLTRRTLGWLVAAAVLLIALVGVGAGVVASRSRVGGPGDQVAQVLGAPDAVTVELKGSRPGTLRLVSSAQEERAVLVGSELSAPPDGRTYQLWAITDGTPRSAAVFSPAGSGGVDVTVDPSTAPAQTWGVTEEPAGGSPAPTGEVLYSSATV